MNQLTNYNSNDTSLSQPTKTTLKPKIKRKIHAKCNECNKRLSYLDGICRNCYKTKTIFKPSGNKIIDDFIRYTQINFVEHQGKMEFVPFGQFKNIEFIAEGGFSKIYKATWIDGPINWDSINNFNISRISRTGNHTVVLKKLNNSKNITSKELNELKIFYDYHTKTKKSPAYYSNSISKYYGITQDLDTQDFMIIMPYYDSGDLIHYISSDFYNIKWIDKLRSLLTIAKGLNNIHSVDIIHRDLHSGNILFSKEQYRYYACIGDLGISKSATESTDNNENYGIIPYMAPEIFQGQKYTKASDIYSFGMIMWEFMTGRRPFWDRNHDIELILDISDGLRPPIVTNAPEDYIELMKECWNSDPDKRPTATDLYSKIYKISKEEDYYNSTKIIHSLDIGPVKTGAIYKSRPLSGMINSAMSLWSLRSQSIDFKIVKRKFEDDLIEFDNVNVGQSKRRKKLFENENNDNLTKEIELDIDTNFNNNEYITKEYDFDIEF